MAKTIGQKIKELRERSGFKLSQEQVAKYVWINRVVLANIELGVRDLEPNVDNEIIKKIAELFEIDPIELVSDKSEVISKVSSDDEYNKFKNLILYILAKCWHKPNVGKTVLNKLLYFSDFNYYENAWESITKETYHKLPMWPVPKNIDKVLWEMERDNHISKVPSEYGWYKQIKFIPNVRYDLSKFNWLEIKVVDEVIEKLSNMTANQISEYSHRDVPYMVAKNLCDEISYRQVSHRTEEYIANPENND